MPQKSPASQQEIFREVMLTILDAEITRSIQSLPETPLVKPVEVVDHAPETNHDAFNNIADFSGEIPQIFPRILAEDISLRAILGSKQDIKKIQAEYTKYAQRYNAGNKKVTGKHIPKTLIPETLDLLCHAYGIRGLDMRNALLYILGKQVTDTEIVPVLISDLSRLSQSPFVKTPPKVEVTKGNE